jgi:biopolymer transport protein ExbD
MASKFLKREPFEDDIDVTPFMNLMVVLIPVLLLSMSFFQLNVIELKLAELTGGRGLTKDPQAKLEIHVRQDGYRVYYPERTLIKRIPKIKVDGETRYDERELSLVLQALKEGISSTKRDALIRAQSNVDYQAVIGALGTTKSYKTVVAANVVEVELFPEVAIDELY